MTDSRFQNIIDGVAGYVGDTAGIIGENGDVIACTDPALIGKNERDALAGGRFLIKDAGGMRVFVSGSDDTAERVCGMLAFTVSDSQAVRDTNEERAGFIGKLIRGDALPEAPVGIADRLGIRYSEPRTVYAVRAKTGRDIQPYQVLSRIFSDGDDFVVHVGGDDYAVVTGAGTAEGDDAGEIADSIVDVIGTECFVSAAVGIGTTAGDLGKLQAAYSDALFALETGRLFYPGRAVSRSGSLGVAGLINGLPKDACRAFLSEVKGAEQFDAETLATVQAFFDNGLNVSETARSIFVHRNTLLYRIEKIRRLTGLDIRTFDQAVTLRLALMVRKYLEGTS